MSVDNKDLIAATKKPESSVLVTRNETTIIHEVEIRGLWVAVAILALGLILSLNPAVLTESIYTFKDKVEQQND